MNGWVRTLGLAAALIVSACGPKPAEKAQPVASGTLRIYNWSDYIADDTLTHIRNSSLQHTHTHTHTTS